jgi:quercetin dioxygenase-like cupin family protein
VPIIDTAGLQVLEKRPGWRGKLIHSATMTFAHWDFDAGSDIHEHRHEQEEVWHVLEGELQITIGDETHIAGPGVVAIIPPHTSHAVKALTAGKAIVADFPVRADFG